MASAAVALLAANSGLASAYGTALATPVFGGSLLHWINDGLMSVFFLLVGLEIKRELAVGELADWRARALPGFAAFGGMLVPALIYVGINSNSPETIHGWAIPAATDIAFSLGLLALLGRRVPLSLKIFLTALAILDDLGAVLIIALFYASNLSFPLLGAAAIVFLILLAMNVAGVRFLSPYLLAGGVLWMLLLHSGVHPTIAGVAVGFMTPLGPACTHSPLHRLERALSPWVGFLVLPVFGFANAGVSLFDLTPETMLSPITLGAAVGLFIGKQVGVFGAAILAIVSGVARRPRDVTFLQLYGVAVLCGIGFTMSIFIGLLAFGHGDEQSAAKLGIIAGSFASGLFGFLLLRLARPMSAGRPT